MEVELGRPDAYARLQDPAHGVLRLHLHSAIGRRWSPTALISRTIPDEGEVLAARSARRWPRCSVCCESERRRAHRALLTGGFGYLGGRLAQRLARADHIEVVLGSRHPSRPCGVVPPDRLHGADRLVPVIGSCAGQLCHELDAIVHLAGMRCSRTWSRDPIGALEFNGLATARLVRAAVAQRVSRFVYISSAHVYGTAAMRHRSRWYACPQLLRIRTRPAICAGEDALRAASGGD